MGGSEQGLKIPHQNWGPMDPPIPDGIRVWLFLRIDLAEPFQIRLNKQTSSTASLTISWDQDRISWGIQGLPKVSLGPAMPIAQPLYTLPL
jgi:hypothetical protein